VEPACVRGRVRAYVFKIGFKVHQVHHFVVTPVITLPLMWWTSVVDLIFKVHRLSEGPPL
jgi:hypothetical protein